MAEWDLDGDELKARRPGVEPHVVHPELGVEQVESEFELPNDRGLGLRWLALPADEQRLRCRDMLRALLEEARAGGAEARYRPFLWEEELNPDLPLDDAAIERVLDWVPEDGLLSVERDGRRWCEFVCDAGVRELRAGIVWIEPWDAGALEERLSRAWWEPAQARQRTAEGRALPVPRDGGRVSRETRAHVLHGWNKVATPVLITFAAWFGGTRLGLPELVGALAAVIVALAVAWTVDGALGRWHERG